MMLHSIPILMMVFGLTTVADAKVGILAEMKITYSLKGVLESTADHENGLSRVVNDLLGNEVWCHWVCDEEINTCYECDVTPVSDYYSTENTKMYVIYIGLTEVTDDLYPAMSEVLEESIVTLFNHNTEYAGFDTIAIDELIPVFFSIQLAASSIKIKEKETEVVTAFETVVSRVEFYHICDADFNCERFSEATLTEEKKVYQVDIRVGIPMNALDTLDEKVQSLRVPLHNIFGQDDVRDLWWNKGQLRELVPLPTEVPDTPPDQEPVTGLPVTSEPVRVTDTPITNPITSAPVRETDAPSTDPVTGLPVTNGPVRVTDAPNTVGVTEVPTTPTPSKEFVVSEIVVTHSPKGVLESTANHEDGLGRVVDDLLGNEVWCHSICFGPAFSCYECDFTPVGDYPTEPSNIRILYFGYAEVADFDMASSSLIESVNSLFGAANVNDAYVEENPPEVPVFVFLKLDASMKELLDNYDEIKDIMGRVFIHYNVRQSCDADFNCEHFVDATPTEEKQVYQLESMSLVSIDYFSDLNERLQPLKEPLEAIFGQGDVLQVWSSLGYSEVRTPSPFPLTEVPDTPPDQEPVTGLPTTGSPLVTGTPPSQEQRVSVNLGITIELDTLVASSPSLATKTQAALEGSEGGAACVSICGTEQTGTVFTPTAECYSCSGASLAKRAARTAEVKRWILTIVGTASISKQTFVEDIDAALRDYVLQIGGSLDTIEVNAEGIPIHPNGSDSDDGLAAGAIAGIVVGSVVFVAIVVAVSYWLCSRNREADDQQDNEMDKEMPAPDSV